jgi:hypothetical protein
MYIHVNGYMSCPDIYQSMPVQVRRGGYVMQRCVDMKHFVAPKRPCTRAHPRQNNSISCFASTMNESLNVFHVAGSHSP